MSWNSIILSLVFLFLFLSSQSSISQETWIRSGYWHSSSLLPISDIDSTLFSHLIYAFAQINSSSYHLQFNSSQEQYFSTFSASIKIKNPSVISLLSVFGGEEALPVFASMINHSSTRKSFIDSSISTARLNDFNGLDLYGIVPDKTINMTNLGTLLEEWRVAIVAESKTSGKSELLLVMSGYYLPTLNSVSYPIGSMASNLDWIHLLTYGYYVPTRDNVTAPHAALCGPPEMIKSDVGVNSWASAGVSYNKLLLGLPYFGYAWTVVNPNGNPFWMPASGPAITSNGLMDYKDIKSVMQNNGSGAAAGYNDTYVANFFSVGKIWINYDDFDAIQAKVHYARENKLLGYNVFHLAYDDNWTLSLAAYGSETSSGHNTRKLLIPILVTTSVVILLMATVIFCYLQREGIIRCWKRSQSWHINSDAPNLQAFSFSTLKAATNNFSNENKLGKGGFGPVHKGTLPGGKEIAVKRLSKTSHQGEEEFKNEVTLTARLQHFNLVRLLGFCTEREEKMLIYEFMPRKSLDFYLFDPVRRGILDWTKRVQIIEGVTQGLLYLQEYSNYTIIHRDLKAGNILLDEEMNPKISDFGMARLFSKGVAEANTGRIVGTYGYIPPEYVKNGVYSMKYDVYSFGVLLLQIVSSKRTACFYGPNENLSLLDYAYDLWKRGESKEFMDPSLDDSSSYCKLIICLQVALLCVQENPLERPCMKDVSNMLKNESAAIASPERPAFSINRHENAECVSRNTTFSVDDATISQLVPR